MKKIFALTAYCISLSLGYVHAQTKALTKQLNEFDAYFENARKQCILTPSEDLSIKNGLESPLLNFNWVSMESLHRSIWTALY